MGTLIYFQHIFMFARNAALASGGMTNCWFRCGCRGREPGYPGPPAQIPACGFPALGSYRRSDAIAGVDAVDP